MYKLPIEKSEKQSGHMRTSKTGKVFSAGSGVKKEQPTYSTNARNEFIDNEIYETHNPKKPQEKLYEGWIKERDNKIDSLHSGIKNLKINLKNQIEYYEMLIKTNSKQSEFPDKITEGKLMGLKRATELLDYGLKHLI